MVFKFIEEFLWQRHSSYTSHLVVAILYRSEGTIHHKRDDVDHCDWRFWEGLLVQVSVMRHHVSHFDRVLYTVGTGSSSEAKLLLVFQNLLKDVLDLTSMNHD